jgi:hypothetical protein
VRFYIRVTLTLHEWEKVAGMRSMESEPASGAAGTAGFLAIG